VLKVSLRVIVNLALSSYTSLVAFPCVSNVRAEDDMVKFHITLGLQGIKKTFEEVNSFGSALLIKYENFLAISESMIRVRQES
jgi:hypothetical protein